MMAGRSREPRPEICPSQAPPAHPHPCCAAASGSPRRLAGRCAGRRCAPARSQNRRGALAGRDGRAKRAQSFFARACQRDRDPPLAGSRTARPGHPPGSNESGSGRSHCDALREPPRSCVVAEVNRGETLITTVIALPRSAAAPFRTVPALAVEKELIWEQESPIFDLALLDTVEQSMAVLEADKLSLYKRRGDLWELRRAFSIPSKQ